MALGEYQKDFAIAKLDIAIQKLEGLCSRESACFSPESTEELYQVLELLKKTKEHVSNV